MMGGAVGKSDQLRSSGEAGDTFTLGKFAQAACDSSSMDKRAGMCLPIAYVSVSDISSKR
jgi:hypothetical protein